MIRQCLAEASKVGTTGNRMVDAAFVAGTGVKAEARNPHILALRFKEPAASLGLEETP